MKIFKVLLFLSIPLVPSFAFAQRIMYSPPEFRLPTEWTDNVNPDNPLPEYPRPAMQRNEWKSLNGRWHFTKTGKNDPRPSTYDKEIIVPFPVESALSGIYDSIAPGDKIWYKRTFFIPDNWSGRFVLLHIGASDWETTVFINGIEIGKHRGGYTPFSFDISPYLDERGVQEIIVSVWDPTDAYHQPRGKQKLNPHGIWYTPVSGIWQTVWIEPVNLSSIESIKCTPDIDQSLIHVSTRVYNPLPEDSVRYTIAFNGNSISKNTFQHEAYGSIKLSNQKLWSPDNPHLYDLKLELFRKGEKIDEVRSYFGMRKISISEDKEGFKRLFLNNEPIFQYGLLDQGWWPDGLYTAPTDQALKSDIIRTKEMGFNLIRKHVKVEPQRWYTYCDQEGIIVWQDMPNSDKHAEWKSPGGIDGVEIKREFVSEAQYKLEFEEIINSFYNHPSIVKWIPFNEAWGQFNTVEIFNWVATIDSTRLLGGPSGGNFFPVGHTRDFHVYPGPGMPVKDPERALILGEFGGLGLPVQDHLWQKDKNWGYRTLQKQKDLEKSYLNMVEKLKPFINQGLAGAIYTQTTDVEGEVNGTMTYDRKVVKFKSNKVKRAHNGLYHYFNEFVK